MARVQGNELILDPQGSLLVKVDAATVWIMLPDGVTPATLYTTKVGGTTITQPLTTENGMVVALGGGAWWLDPGVYIRTATHPDGRILDPAELNYPSGVDSATLVKALKNDEANLVQPPTGLSTDTAGIEVHPSGTARKGIRTYHITAITGSASDKFRSIEAREDYLMTDAATGFTNTHHGICSTLYYGSTAVQAKGTVHASTTEIVVQGSAHPDNEMGLYVGVMRFDIGTGYSQTVGPAGRAWFTDWGLHGPIDVQPDLLNGITMVVNNHYNGSPADGPSAGMWIVTKPNSGAGVDATHGAAATYKFDVGLGIVGTTTGTNRGFETALRIGGNGSGWTANTRVGTGVYIRDWEDYGLRIDSRYTGGTGPGIYCDQRITLDQRLQLKELVGAPAAPTATYLQIYARDNGSGKQELVVMFDDGSTQTIKTQV